MALQPGLPEAHQALAGIYHADRQMTQALLEYQAALERQPSNAEILESIAWVQTDLGLWEESFETLKRAMTLNPRLGRLACWAGGRCFGLRDFKNAIDLPRSRHPSDPRQILSLCLSDLDLHELGRRNRSSQKSPRGDSERTWTWRVGHRSTIPGSRWRLWMATSQPPWRFSIREPGRHMSFVRSMFPRIFFAPKSTSLWVSETVDELSTSQPATTYSPKSSSSRKMPGFAAHWVSRMLAWGNERLQSGQGELSLELLLGSQAETLGYILKDTAQIYTMLGEKDKALDQLQRLLSAPALFAVAGYLQLDPYVGIVTFRGPVSGADAEVPALIPTTPDSPSRRSEPGRAS